MEAWESNNKRLRPCRGPFRASLSEPSLQDGGDFRNRPRPALAALTTTWAIRTDLTGPENHDRQWFRCREFPHRNDASVPLPKLVNTNRNDIKTPSTATSHHMGAALIGIVASCVASRRLATTGFLRYLPPRRLKTCGYQNKKRTDTSYDLKRYHSLPREVEMSPITCNEVE